MKQNPSKSICTQNLFRQKFPQFLNVGQSLLQVLRHLGRGFVGGHAHRLVVILNDIFHKFLVA